MRDNPRENGWLNLCKDELLVIWYSLSDGMHARFPLLLPRCMMHMYSLLWGVLSPLQLYPSPTWYIKPKKLCVMQQVPITPAIKENSLKGSE